MTIVSLPSNIASRQFSDNGTASSTFLVSNVVS
jgi:hypothetical protein